MIEWLGDYIRNGECKDNNENINGIGDNKYVVFLKRKRVLCMVR